MSSIAIRRVTILISVFFFVFIADTRCFAVFTIDVQDSAASTQSAFCVGQTVSFIAHPDCLHPVGAETYSWTLTGTATYTWSSGTTNSTSTAAISPPTVLPEGAYTISVSQTIVNSNGPDFVYSASNTFTIVDLNTPTTSDDPLILGKDGTITYKIISPDTSTFNSIEIHIINTGAVEVWKKDSGLSTTPNLDQTVTWEKIKWNTGSHSGAFANPKNGKYKIKITGKMAHGHLTKTVQVNTKLIIEADIKDERPTGSTATAVAGLSDLGSALKLVMKNGASETSFSGSDLTLTNGTGTVAPTVYVKHLKTTASGLNSLDSGAYKVLFKDMRDAIGNFSDNDNTASNGIQSVEFDLDLE